MSSLPAQNKSSEVVHDLDWHIENICESWRDSVEGIVETGRRVEYALGQLPHGEKAQLWERLPFSQPAGAMLVVIANNAERFYQFTNNLPAAWYTLYELTRLKDEQLPEFFDEYPEPKQGDVRKWLRALGMGDFPDASDLPAGTYSLIYADPPWRYEHSKTDNRKIENQYPTMSLDEIKNLPVSDIEADDCVLFLWATSPKLSEAMEVIEAWGFTYRTCAVWIKDKIGMGYYFRQQHELLLVAAKGTPGAPPESSRKSSVMSLPRGRHSSKPNEVREHIELMYPGAAKVELFCRDPRDGWSAWGNEV